MEDAGPTFRADPVQAGADPPTWLKRRKGCSPRLLGEKAPRAPGAIKAGTRLYRSWQGVTHEVLVMDSGYSWRGKSYASLSEVARAITGTRWSGPRFFGLQA